MCAQEQRIVLPKNSQNEEIVFRVGTHIYMAPEMFYAHHQYGLPVDVYALAISFWEMLYRRYCPVPAWVFSNRDHLRT